MRSIHKDLVLDIETLGTNINCPIWEIAMMSLDCSFIRTDGMSVFNHIYSSNDYFSLANHIKWSIKNSSSSVIKYMDSKITEHELITYIHTQISDYLKSNPNAIIWCRGTDFDKVRLENKFKYYELEIPWTYYQWADIRTLQIATGIQPSVRKIENAHTAMGDVENEREHLLKMLACIKNIN